MLRLKFRRLSPGGVAVSDVAASLGAYRRSARPRTFVTVTMNSAQPGIKNAGRYYHALVNAVALIPIALHDLMDPPEPNPTEDRMNIAIKIQLGSAPALAQGSAGKPNLLFIMGDDNGPLQPSHRRGHGR